MQKNEEIIINITDITDEGSGVGKYDGIVIFVPSAAVGSTVQEVKSKPMAATCAAAIPLWAITPRTDSVRASR